MSHHDNHCVGTPVSWFLLEQQRLGLLATTQSATIASHLEVCKACQRRFETTEQSVALLPFPALVSQKPKVLKFWQRPSWWRGWAVASAVLATLLIVIVARNHRPGILPDTGPDQLEVKGEQALELVVIRERNGIITTNAKSFLSSDRFKVTLTCQSGLTRFRVVVYQQNEVSIPIDQSLVCGNSITLPGAFHVTGGPALLCVIPGEDPIPELGRAALFNTCQWLAPEREGVDSPAP